ncbi:dihydrofolate reductase family protein [Haloarcula pelagica]|uniref:dihydrofolate reductase family protein n=1 Tax=Haloarcula pelagica TaxID=3033389 RepID=UPI0024C38742|nr:dihydrofolate reductase family protein [Halomicroarcula sp. YJ-61-S]
MSAGKITLYIAASVDGYIADEDGGVAWLSEFEEAASEDDIEEFTAFFESVDCLVMGATTYEQVLTFGEWPYDDKPTYVFTHRDLSPATDAVEFVDQPVADVSTHLKEQYGHIWLVGGAQLAEAFFHEQEIDALRLSLVPVLLGGGVPLFAGEYDQQSLRLLDTTRREGGIVEHQYVVCG